MATAGKDPETIIREFFAIWPERNVDRFLDFFTDDAVYHNMPLEPVSGKNGIREVLNLFLPADEIEAEIVHLAAHGTASSPSASTVSASGRNGSSSPAPAYSRSATGR